jgi:hypothetical protein
VHHLVLDLEKKSRASAATAGSGRINRSLQRLHGKSANETLEQNLGRLAAANVLND